MKQDSRNINIISVYYGHNASVAYLRNGRVLECISEERLNRIKNSIGFPNLSLKYVLEKYGKEIDYYVFTQKYSYNFEFIKTHGLCPAKNDYQNEVALRTSKTLLLQYFPKYWYKRKLKEYNKFLYGHELNDKGEKEMIAYFCSLLEVSRDKLIFLDHHLSHAYSVLFFNNRNRKIIFTLDGEGDGYCATVSLFDGKELKNLSRVGMVHSLGYLFQEVTIFLGMKPNEHEFKVMGLAAYAERKKVMEVKKIFEKILWLNKKDEFESKIPMSVVRSYLRDNLSYIRFDLIAGAIQMFTEEIVVEWMKRWILKTGYFDVGIGGGVFMNVKLNKQIVEIDEVKSLVVVPSASDESTVLGGCYYGYKHYCKKNKTRMNIEEIENLYLGTEYTIRLDDLVNFIDSGDGTYSVKTPKNINLEVAKLLSEDKIVARFSGRMEFGARALGNRSILANPQNIGNINRINDLIKKRDFWMPFAATILSEDAERYIDNEKQSKSPFMAMAFKVKPVGQKDLIAAIHSRDKTIRPQLLEKGVNDDYRELILEFRRLTGIGGVLNTSFNLHGEPNVESSKDALQTFQKSGLEYLAIGQFLLSKNNK